VCKDECWVTKAVGTYHPCKNAEGVFYTDRPSTAHPCEGDSLPPAKQNW
jgi:hypothetical protein